MNHDVAVLIVSYNTCQALERALKSIPEGVQTVVVDNASHDGTVAHVRDAHPQVILYEAPGNRGFSWAINKAAALTKRPYLLILNPDAWLTGDAVEQLKRSLDIHAKRLGAWAVGPRQIDDAGRLQLSMGPRPTLVGEATRRVVQRRLDRPETLLAHLTRMGLQALWPRPAVVPWVAGSAIMVKRKHFMRIGGFDPSFFLYFEDIDFCLRIGRAGGTVVFDPTITLGHSRGVSANTARALAQAAYRDSQTYFAGRHGSRLFARFTAIWSARRRAAMAQSAVLPQGASAASGEHGCQ